MHQTETIKFTRGDTFSYAGEARLVYNSSVVADYTGWNIECVARNDKDEVVSTAVCAWIDATLGLFTVYIADTSAWKVAQRLRIRVKFTTPDGLNSVSSPVIVIMVQ